MARAASPERLTASAPPSLLAAEDYGSITGFRWLQNNVLIVGIVRKSEELAPASSGGVRSSARQQGTCSSRPHGTAEPDTARVPHEAAAAHTYLMLLAGSPMAMWSLSISMR